MRAYRRGAFDELNARFRRGRCRVSIALSDCGAYGPLFAVSDDGNATEIIVAGAYASAKARALRPIDPADICARRRMNDERGRGPMRSAATAKAAIIVKALFLLIILQSAWLPVMLNA